MVRRLWRDESGMALGLAVILVAVIGLMAAGFLALVRDDLEAGISANQGQRAFALADAGAQAGVAQLRQDADPGHYDASAPENTEWAYVAPDGGPPGRGLDLDDGTARVTVRYLRPATEEDLADEDQPDEENYAPEPLPAGSTDYPDRDFFAVVSEATSGGTRRKVEVIVCAVISGDAHEIQQWSWREVYK